MRTALRNYNLLLDAHLFAGSDMQSHQDQQYVSHKSGMALKGHCRSAHQGKEDPKCPACIELRKFIR